jgi:hypothetical protein
MMMELLPKKKTSRWQGSRSEYRQKMSKIIMGGENKAKGTKKNRGRIGSYPHK